MSYVFNSFGEQIKAVIKSNSPNSKEIDKRLMQMRSASGMSEGIGADGGFMVQENFSDALLSEVWDESEILKRVTRIPITNGNSIKIPGLDETSRATGARGGALRLYWAADGRYCRVKQTAIPSFEFGIKKIACDYLLDRGTTGGCPCY